ncbi:hypothetical protein ABIE33_006982 [Ensifer sp. 4252]
MGRRANVVAGVVQHQVLKVVELASIYSKAK